MQLSIYVGSPRNEKSNTMALMREFIKGFLSTDNNTYELFFMYKQDNETLKKDFMTSKNILMAFPLYWYAMPSRVKDFIEYIEPFLSSANNVNIGFVVQFGLPEAFHARPLEAYLKNYIKKYYGKNIGVFLIGGCEGIDKGACFFNKPALRGMYLMGKSFGQRGDIDVPSIKKYFRTEDSVNFGIDIINKMIVYYLNKVHWNKLLKRNGCSVKDSYSRPYAP